MSSPDLNLLITLNARLIEGSVAGATRRLQLSPSAMSRALARLRETTGDPLLVRAGHGLVPTPRATHRQSARRNAQLRSSRRHAGVHGFDALAPQAACRSSASLAARLRAARLREGMTRSILTAGMVLLQLGCDETRPAPSSSPADAPAPPSAALALEGEGLRVFTVPSGAARPISFGAPKSSTLATIDAVLRTSPREQGHSTECQAEYAAWANGLTVWFSRDRFVGWFARGGDGSLTTASGVGIGSTRAEVEGSYVVEVFPSSLGVEFAAGELAGLLDAPDPDGEVIHLWAGEVCLAR